MKNVMRTLDQAAAAFVAREREWLRHDHRGRWAVVEPGAGRWLKGSSASVRKLADHWSERRVRRFSSLSKARSFARAVHGRVVRWHHAPRRGLVRQSATPWAWAVRKTTQRMVIRNVMQTMEYEA